MGPTGGKIGIVYLVHTSALMSRTECFVSAAAFRPVIKDSSTQALCQPITSTILCIITAGVKTYLGGHLRVVV